MSIRVTSLASGSSGNALVIHAAGAALLVDCGLPQRSIERHLRQAGLEPADISAIVLTHEHGDHAQSAGPLARRYNIPVVANRPTLMALGPSLEDVATIEQTVGESIAVGPYEVRSFPVQHDAAAPVGYSICANNWCVGVAIDLGTWTPTVRDALRDADLIVVEANHDREKLRAAPYQWPVKQRIFSPFGHLDNVAAGELLAQLGADGRKRTAWLAHLSEQANSPDIALRMVRSVLALADVRCINVNALPRRAPLTWESDRHLTQMELFSW